MGNLLKYSAVAIIGLAMVACGDDDEKEDDLISGGHEAVDLGLSVKWATSNVGGEQPDDFGGYYAWGETEEKEDYSKANYHELNPDNKYMDISGSDYDVAHVKWGGKWRMPTIDEFQELVRSCNWEWEITEGVSGYKVTGPNGNSIFLPAAGRIGGKFNPYLNDSGWYWTSTDKGLGSRFIIFGEEYIDTKGDGWSDYGMSVRAVVD